MVVFSSRSPGVRLAGQIEAYKQTGYTSIRDSFIWEAEDAHEVEITDYH
jgi:hypothetical protein